jgi:hypothetical protein
LCVDWWGLEVLLPPPTLAHLSVSFHDPFSNWSHLGGNSAPSPSRPPSSTSSPHWASCTRACAKFSLSCDISRSTSTLSSTPSKLRIMARVSYVPLPGKPRGLFFHAIAEYPSRALIGSCPLPWSRVLGTFPILRRVHSFILRLPRRLSKCL